TPLSAIEGQPPPPPQRYIRSVWTFTPSGDDAQVAISFAPAADSTGTAPSLPPYSFTAVVPVDGLIGFTPPKVSFSVGVLWSQHHDDSVVLVPNSADTSLKTSVVTLGQANRQAAKGLALFHINFLKIGDNLFGPSAGVVAGSPVGYFAGVSYLFGK